MAKVDHDQLKFAMFDYFRRNYPEASKEKEDGYFSGVIDTLEEIKRNKK